jgi:hypothetical protein
MSYCVSCGVELAASEPVCPLCDTPVLNPRNPWKAPAVRPWPAYLESIARTVDRRYVSGLIAVLLAIPVAVCVIVNVLSPSSPPWSAFVAGGALCLALAVLLPLAWGGRGFGVYLAADALAALAFLAFIDSQTGGRGWFLPLAAPITLSAAALLWLLVHGFRRRKKKGVLPTLALWLAAVGVFTVLLEVYVRVWQGESPAPHWSWYAVIPCGLTAAAFLILDSRNRWKESVKKRLFF